MEPNDTTQACTILTQKLTQLSTAQSECTIYRVHRHLRDVNPRAYEPEVIAIGPYHRHKDDLKKMMEDHKLRYYDLKMMEDHKLRYLHLLLRRENQNVERYVSAVGPLESRARKCYAEPISLNATEFIETLVLDGCFIIELVRKYHFNMRYLREKNDPIFRMDWIINSLQRDLMLFENQIPFFVLCELFDLIEAPEQHARLIHLFLCFFNILHPGRVHGRINVSSHEIKHLLDLIHRSWLPPPFDPLDSGEDERNKAKGWRFIDSASGLREANVKFERNEEVSLFDIKFRNGIITMAPLTIEDRTESFFRNLIAYEQYFQDNQDGFVTAYVKFLDCLIDSPKDIEILRRQGIIENNWLGDDEVVAKIVNKLTDSVAGPANHFRYAGIFEDVNKYCGRRKSRWMAKLRRNYLSSPWAVISIIVAVVLLLLTITQTLFTILQVV